MKSAEEFIRHKAFPLDNKSDEEWKEWKHTHKGINWVGFSIEVMKEYATQQATAFSQWKDENFWKGMNGWWWRNGENSNTLNATAYDYQELYKLFLSEQERWRLADSCSTSNTKKS